jgi:hypothetical protein
VMVCIDYSGTSLAGTPTQPTLGHYNSATGLWEVVHVTSWDMIHNRICGTVGSLSPFALLVPVDVTPPIVTCSVSPNVLWPPNHKLVSVTAIVTVADAQSGPAGFTLTSVTSSEPDNGRGDGDVPNDIQGFAIGAASISGRLRAERSGAGRGRVYTLTYTGRDQAGNSATCTATVTVPHNRAFD